MNVKLTIQEKLKDLRIERHLTLEQLAAETGISKSALGKYESDDFKDISPFSITTLAKYYGVSTDYLLGLTETKNHPNADLQDLHLSDEMIALLKSGSINNRLLSELALHRDFQRFLVDIEIFVDRIADMRIHDMNALLEANRQQIIQQNTGRFSPIRKELLFLCFSPESDNSGRRTRKIQGITVSRHTVIPRTFAAIRHPKRSTIHPQTGLYSAPATPEADKAIPSASPRR